MEGTNKVLALFVGLFVVILVIGLGLSRLSKNKKPLSGSLGTIFNTKTTPTPTPKKTTNNTGSIAIVTKQLNQPMQYAPNPTSIPETGATTLPIIASSLTLGILLLKKKAV